MTGQFVRVSARVPLAQRGGGARASRSSSRPAASRSRRRATSLVLRLYVDESAVEAIRAAFPTST